MYERDTIAAIATARGAGAIGIIRVSGPDSEAIAERVFARRARGPWRSHRMYAGTVRDEAGRAVDAALAVLFRGPRSYTGEDVLELHLHGSLVVLERALAVVTRAGARPAAPGEFTRRAFLNGKLDLAQAEAVSDLVRAGSAQMAEVAAAHLGGHLSAFVGELRELLVRALALVEAEIDFSDEGDVDAPAKEALPWLWEATGRMQRLLATYRAGRLLREGVRVVIAGPPNVGKSTLFNALLGRDRAIVSPVPGTTRDVLEGETSLGGVPALLFDTAGWRQAPEEIEREGVSRAQRSIEDADLVLMVADLSVAPRALPPLPDGKTWILVLNKADLPPRWSREDETRVAGDAPRVRVSALTMEGLDDLRETAARVLRADALPEDGLVLTRARHQAAVREACTAAMRAASALAQGALPELVAVEVASAIAALDSLTGRVQVEEVLDRIFREFCIGK